MTSTDKRLSVPAFTFALAAAALWGGNTVAIKVGLTGLPPLALAGVRFILGGGVVALWAGFARVPLRADRGEIRSLGILAVLFLIQITLLNVATHLTLASRSILFLSTYPLFTSVFSHFWTRDDRLTVLRSLGMLLSFVGLIVLFAEGFVAESGNPWGDLMALGSGALLGLRFVYTKRLTAGTHPAKILTWQAMLTVPAFIILSLIFEPLDQLTLSRAAVWAILYQGLVVAGLCFIIQVTLISRYAASRISAFAFTTPVFGVVLSYLLLHEPLSSAMIGSMVLVGAGIVVINLSRR